MVEEGSRGVPRSSWIRGSVLKLKRCIPNMNQDEEMVKGGNVERRRAFEVSDVSSRSSLSQEVYRLSTTRGPTSLTDFSRVSTHRASPNLSEFVHEHTGFQRKDHVNEERKAFKRTVNSCSGDSKAAEIAELVNDRLQACAAVRTPRVPGDAFRHGRRISQEEDAPPLADTFSKKGLLMKVPDYLTKLTGASRGGDRAVPHLKPPDMFEPKKKPSQVTRKIKSGIVASVTVPISAKQWLLQAIGLQDKEIREMFAQMESLPQLAAEHVREVRAEWEALEARANRVPPQADYLVKDRLLLEKVRELIVRFIKCTDPEIMVAAKSHAPSAELPKKADDETQKVEVEEVPEKENTSFQLDPFSKSRSENELPHCGRPVCDSSIQVDEKNDFAGQGEETQKETLPSFIPMEDYVINKYVVQPELLGKPDCKFTYSPCDKRWYTVVFPALQPGKREDVQLLWDWLQHAMQKNRCEKRDGRFENVEAAFVLHSIAFLEIVRQVDIHCEERGNLLLHIWRQLLRIFNQVLVRAEPKLNATEDELKQLRCELEMTKDQLSKLVSDHDFYKEQYDVILNKLKERDHQVKLIKRCRLCCTENMSPRSRSEYLANLKRRSISFRYTPSPADFSPPTEEELKKLEEERLKQEELKRQEEERKKQEAATEEVVEEPQIEELSFEAPPVEEPESQEPEVTESKEPVSSKDQAIQTDANKGLRRCWSAPPNIFPPPKIAEGKVKDEGTERVQGEQVTGTSGAENEVKDTSVPQAELSPADLKDLEGGWVEPDAPAKKKEVDAVGAEKLKEYETLAVDTIGLLDRLPMEGALAEKIETLLKKYCEMTGTVLGEKVREKFMLRTKSIMAKRGSVAPETSTPKVSFMESRPSEMRKSRKSKGSKWGLQLKSYVPLGFSKMMKIYNPPKNVKFFNVRQLSKLIASVYVNKIVADAVDDSCNNERQTCCEFVYDFMLNQYGLKGLSESAIFGVFKTIKTLMTNKEIEKHHKVRLFSRFVGMDETNNYSEPDLYLYLKVLQKASSKLGVLLPSDQDDGLFYLNASQYSFIVDEPNLVSYFGSQGAALSFVEKYVAKNAVTERASPEIRKLVKESEVRKVDWDLLVEAILAVYPHKMDTIQEERRKSIQVSKPVPKDKATELENLFIAGDANQDGVLTFSEFREIVTTADPSISAQSAIRMFRETLLMMPDGGDSISPQAFAQIAYNHGIEAPASTVFDLLKKTWAQVQNDIDPEKVNASKDDYEFSKEVLQDLMQQKVDVNTTVQTFRQFVLRFCGQDEEAEEEAPQASQDEPDSQESQLLLGPPDDADTSELKLSPEEATLTTGDAAHEEQETDETLQES